MSERDPAAKIRACQLCKHPYHVSRCGQFLPAWRGAVASCDCRTSEGAFTEADTLPPKPWPTQILSDPASRIRALVERCRAVGSGQPCSTPWLILAKWGDALLEEHKRAPGMTMRGPSCMCGKLLQLEERCVCLHLRENHAADGRCLIADCACGPGCIHEPGYVDAADGKARPTCPALSRYAAAIQEEVSE